MPLPVAPATIVQLLQRAARHPVIRAAAGFASLTAVVKAAAFCKEAVVASAFGVSSSMDSYLMAFVIIGFPSGLLLNAAQTVFVRDYVRIVQQEGISAADRYLRHAALVLFAVLTGLLILWVALLPTVISVVGHGLATDELRRAVAANVYRMIPYYYLNGINLLGYGALQARGAFVRAALLPILTPLVIMALVVLATDADVSILIGSLTLGTGMETILLALWLSRTAAPIGAAPAAAPAASWVREFAWGTIMLMPGTLVSGLSPIVEQTIASGLGGGAIAALGYAAKLPATLNSLLITAVGVTILPYFAQLLSRGLDGDCRRFFVRYTGILTVAGMAVACVAVAGSWEFVRLAFQRGHFSVADTVLVTALQRAYLWQLPGALVAIVAVRYLAAQGRYRVLTLGNMVMIPVTALLQWQFSRAWGAGGLALGTSFGTALSACMFVWLALRPVRTAVR